MNMDFIQYAIMITLGLLLYIKLKNIFSRDTTRAVDSEIIEAITQIRNAGPELAKKKEKYEKALRDLKSNTPDSKPQG